MSFTCQNLKILITFCLLQWERRVVGEHTAVLSITRLKDGDVFTRITNGSDSMCQSWMAVDIVPFSKQNCSLTCKCKFPHGTFSIRLEKCVKDDEILKLNNCSGPFLPSFNQPLYNFARSGKARLNGNHSADYCQITSIEYYNKTKRVKLTGAETKFLNISRIENGSLSLTWANQNMNIPQGNIVKLQILCHDNMTSPSRNRCVLIKTAETLITNHLTGTKSPEKSSVCANNPKTATDDMLIYILVGVGSGCVFVGGLVGLFACLRIHHRRRRDSSVSRPRTTIGLHRPFKARSSNKGNEPSMPAIHEMIFNGLIWDDDGGFSNRAITADPRFFEVDYGIPTDFSGSLTRPESSCESVRNSLSPLTDLGETAKR